MKLNPFVWNNFVESKNGREWINFFTDLKSKYRRSATDLKSFLRKQGAESGPASRRIPVDDEVKDVLATLKKLNRAERDRLIPNTVDGRKSADLYFKKISDLTNDKDEDESLFTVDDISSLSIALFCRHPQYFFPYFYYPNFPTLTAIFDGFGIFLPPVPPRRDYEGRYFYYLELCRSLYNFWQALGFDTEHIPAFLYGFAPQVLNLRSPEISPLPPPNRAWFLGGGVQNGDAAFLDNVTPTTKSVWTGNKDTEVGDILVIYLLSPRSAIHSIWRAIRPGGIEPFRSYYQTVWMGYPQLVKPVSIADLKNDPVLSKMPLVKGNLQGINGRHIPKSFYDRLLVLLERKGNNTKKLPQLKDAELVGIKLKTEKDVEAKLLEPLLKNLGYGPTDWQRQVRVRVGRGEKVIPDYLVNVTADKRSGRIHADWVWEAKFSIGNNDRLSRDFGQVCSYGNLVNARGVGLVSKEGIWVSSALDNFRLDKAQHWSAQQLNELDHLSEIRAFAGKRALSRRRPG